jgi:hypothetical protein
MEYWKWDNHHGTCTLYLAFGKVKQSKVHVYSPISQFVQRTVQFTPWYWNSLFHGFIFLGRMQCIIHAAEAIHTISIFHSTRYPLLLGGQRQCRFKSCPRILYVTSSMPGIEPQTFRSQVQYLTTEPRTLQSSGKIR